MGELKQKSFYVEEQGRSKSQAHSKKIDDITLMQENKLSDSMIEDRKQSHGTAGVLRYEHQISNDSKKSKRKKEKIVVSKLAKSDRPLRAKNAEKQPKEK